MNHSFKIALWTFRITLCCHLKLLRFSDDIISLCCMSGVHWIASSQTSHVESLTPAWLYLETSYTQPWSLDTGRRQGPLVVSHWAWAHRLGWHRGLTEHPLSLGTRLPPTFRSLLSAFSFLTSETLWFSCWFWLIAPPIHTFQKALSSRVLFSVKSLSRRCCAPSESQSPAQCWRCLRAGPSLFWGLFTQPLVVHAPWLRPGPCSCDFPLSPSLQPLQCEAAQSHSICNPALFVLNTTHCHPGYNPFTRFRLSDCLPSREDEPLLQILLAYHCVSTPVLTHRTQKHQHLLAGWGRTTAGKGAGWLTPALQGREHRACHWSWTGDEWAERKQGPNMCSSLGS